MELSKRSILSGSNQVQRVLLLNSVDSGDSVVLKVSVAVVERENHKQDLGFVSITTLIQQTAIL